MPSSSGASTPSSGPSSASSSACRGAIRSASTPTWRYSASTSTARAATASAQHHDRRHEQRVAGRASAGAMRDDAGQGGQAERAGDQQPGGPVAAGAEAVAGQGAGAAGAREREVGGEREHQERAAAAPASWGATPLASQTARVNSTTISATVGTSPSRRDDGLAIAQLCRSPPPGVSRRRRVASTVVTLACSAARADPSRQLSVHSPEHACFSHVHVRRRAHLGRRPRVDRHRRRSTADPCRAAGGLPVR